MKMGRRLASLWGEVRRAEVGRQAALRAARVKVRGGAVCPSFSLLSAVRTEKDVLWAETHNPVPHQLWHLPTGCPCAK